MNFHFLGCLLRFNDVWKLFSVEFMMVSYCALPHVIHKFSHGLTWCPYSFDSQKESEQQYFLCFDYFINFSHENFFLFFLCMFMVSFQLASSYPERRLSLHRNDSYGSRVVKCVHQNFSVFSCSETQKQNAHKKDIKFTCYFSSLSIFLLIKCTNWALTTNTFYDV